MDVNDIKNLLGLKLYNIGRASDMCWMIFSSEKEDIFYSLHLQCPWRIRKKNNLLLSNLDIYELSSNLVMSGEEWDDSKKTLFDEKVEKLSFINKIKIDNIVIKEMNDLSILLSDSSVIECFVNDSQYECWRFFKKGDEQHLVVTGQGIEE